MEIMERRFSAKSVTWEARAGESPKITGYASVFYNASDPGTEYELWDGMVERIMPTAFDRAIKEDDVRGLYNHDPSLLLGRSISGTLKLSVDAVGLRYEITPPDTQTGRDVLESIRRGDLSGSSFAFIPVSQTWREMPDKLIREINEVQLFDVGPVTYPAYEASTTGLRDAGNALDARAAYEKWRAERDESVRIRRAQVNARLRAIELLGT